MHPTRWRARRAPAGETDTTPGTRAPADATASSRAAVTASESSNTVGAARLGATPSSVALGAPLLDHSSVSPRRAVRKPSRVEPVAAGRYRVQLTVGSLFRDKLERALDLMSHRNPARDLATALERGLDLLIAELEKERLAKSKPSSSQKRAAPVSGSVQAALRGNERSAEARKPRAVSRRVRRQVFERDGERCSYVSQSGERCRARAFLELDHRTPRACGGTGDAENIRVLCRAHNRLAAEESFGRAHVEGQIDGCRRQLGAAAADDWADAGCAALRGFSRPRPVSAATE